MERYFLRTIASENFKNKFSKTHFFFFDINLKEKFFKQEKKMFDVLISTCILITHVCHSSINVFRNVFYTITYFA